MMFMMIMIVAVLTVGTVDMTFIRRVTVSMSMNDRSFRHSLFSKRMVAYTEHPVNVR